MSFFRPERNNEAWQLCTIKAKLREALEKEVLEICKSTEKENPVAEKTAEEPNIRTRRRSFSSSAADQCFERLFECVSTRTNYLNIVKLSSRDSSEPDIDRVILQALLKGKSSPSIGTFLHARFQRQRIRSR